MRDFRTEYETLKTDLVDEIKAAVDAAGGKILLDSTGVTHPVDSHTGEQSEFWPTVLTPEGVRGSSTELEALQGEGDTLPADLVPWHEFEMVDLLYLRPE